MDPVMIGGIYQGEGKWFPFKILNGDGVPIPLGDATFTFHVKANIDDAVPLFVGVDWDYSDAANGIIKVNLPASQTALMSIGTYFAQLKTVFRADTDVDISSIVKFFINKPIVE